MKQNKEKIILKKTKTKNRINYLNEKRSLIPWGYTVPIFGLEVYLGTLKSYEVEGNPGKTGLPNWRDELKTLLADNLAGQ